MRLYDFNIFTLKLKTIKYLSSNLAWLFLIKHMHGFASPDGILIYQLLKSLDIYI